MSILDRWFDEAPASTPLQAGTRLGVVVGGSLSKGLEVKLDRETQIEDLAVGRYVVVRGANRRFFCMVTDIALDNTNPAIKADPPDLSDPFLREIYSGTAAFGTLQVTPMLTIDAHDQILPVKTIPSHFMPVEVATVKDVNDVFGHEDETHFNIGSPLELEETQINLDLKRLVERSIGVFGKSGTGKSFLTRVLLSGTIYRNMAVSLIFDMHNDYGWEVSDERGTAAKGLKQLFPSKVAIFTLDEQSSIRRNAKYDYVVDLGYDEIEPADLAMLKSTMDLSDPMLDAAYALHKRFGKDWLTEFLDMLDGEYIEDFDPMAELRQVTGVNERSLAALASRLRRFERYPFLKKKGVSGDSVRHILDVIIEQRKSVVLEFGRYGNDLVAYILVANYLTRRIHQRYVELVEASLGDKAMQPPQLLITIEEAHKFLDPLIARQTIFGIIARELRKYNVTLLVVDQRPSAIDEEVMSQIGTRVTALLDNDKDISAVLMGVNGAGGLREVLARLETKQQAIVMGHAVPMPVVIKPRTYDADFYASVSGVPVVGAGEDGRSKFGIDRKNRRL
jgi:DNA helicase HerA-like ATPase